MELDAWHWTMWNVHGILLTQPVHKLQMFAGAAESELCSERTFLFCM